MKLPRVLTSRKALTQAQKNMAIAAVVILSIAAVAGYWDPTDYLPDADTDVPSGSVVDETGDVITTIRTATMKWTIRDSITKTATASGDTGYVSIAKATNGVFDFLDYEESTEFDASPDESSEVYSSGDELIFAVSSDNDPSSGAEAYPRWFYIKSLEDGATVYAFPLGNPISALNAAGSSPTYTYTVNTANLEAFGTVNWITGTTPYWKPSAFELYGRVAKASVIEQITAAGVVLTTFNDGATWEDTDAEINANHTMTSDKEDLNFQLIGEANDVAWGLPILSVAANGKVSQHNAVVIITTDALGINTAELMADGWKAISKPDLTADLAFYYTLTTEGVPTVGNKFSISIPFTVEDSGLTASTEYEVEGWALDCQNVANVAAGSTTTSLPGSNGMISEFGLDTIVNPLALTVSSGSAATMQLLTHFTTNA